MTLMDKLHAGEQSNLGHLSLLHMWDKLYMIWTTFLNLNTSIGNSKLLDDSMVDILGPSNMATMEYFVMEY